MVLPHDHPRVGVERRPAGANYLRFSPIMAPVTDSHLPATATDNQVGEETCIEVKTLSIGFPCFC